MKKNVKHVLGSTTEHLFIWGVVHVAKVPLSYGDLDHLRETRHSEAKPRLPGYPIQVSEEPEPSPQRSEQDRSRLDCSGSGSDQACAPGSWCEQTYLDCFKYLEFCLKKNELFVQPFQRCQHVSTSFIKLPRPAPRPPLPAPQVEEAVQLPWGNSQHQAPGAEQQT